MCPTHHNHHDFAILMYLQDKNIHHNELRRKQGDEGQVGFLKHTLLRHEQPCSHAFRNESHWLHNVMTLKGHSLNLFLVMQSQQA
jgi:hypothetical protein